MKKNIIILLISAITALYATVSFAEDTEKPLASQQSETVLGMPQINVNEKAIDLDNLKLSQYIYTENGNTLVPLRVIAEKMGYHVDWNTDKSVTVSNDEWKVVLHIGSDSYYGVTKIENAVGMTAPQSYGAAPRLIEDTTFVPVKMFELMGYQFSIVGQFVNFTNKENVEMPNPFVSYESIDSAAKVLGYKPCIPSYIPDEYNLKNISVMNNRMLQLIYTDKNDNKLIYRTKKGNDDISGDYTIYPINKEVDVNNMSITLRGSKKTANATWQNNGLSYAVLTDKEFDETEMVKLITGIK